nr:hypothetical protein [Atlantibacter hermannii]
MPVIKVRENEPFDVALRHAKKLARENARRTRLY